MSKPSVLSSCALAVLILRRRHLYENDCTHCNIFLVQAFHRHVPIQRQGLEIIVGLQSQPQSYNTATS